MLGLKFQIFLRTTLIRIKTIFIMGGMYLKHWGRSSLHDSKYKPNYKFSNSDIIFKPPCKLKAYPFSFFIILLVQPINNEGGGSDISVDKNCFYPEADISSKRVMCCFMKLKLNYLPPPKITRT